MATLHRTASATYIMDFSNSVSGALDLSCSRQQPKEVYYHRAISPVHHHTFIDEPTKHTTNHIPSHPQSVSPHLETYTKDITPSCFSVIRKCSDNIARTEQIVAEPLNNTLRRENRSPSLYASENKNSTHSPPAVVSGNGSPVYSTFLTSNEQVISPYMLQAAFRQQMILENKKNESDVTSEAGSDESQQSRFPIYPMTTPGRDGKMPRPFKAYPKDPMSLAAGFTTVDALLDSQSAEKYSAFRKRMLDQICAANGGQATVSNPKMRRTVNTSNNNCYGSDDGSSKYDHPSQDNSYTERRKKNNAAAKKSRDRRRIKEDEIAIRAAFLERENIELKYELATARKQLALYGISVPPNSK